MAELREDEKYEIDWAGSEAWPFELLDHLQSCILEERGEHERWWNKACEQKLKNDELDRKNKQLRVDLAESEKWREKFRWSFEEMAASEGQECRDRVAAEEKVDELRRVLGMVEWVQVGTLMMCPACNAWYPLAMLDRKRKHKPDCAWKKVMNK